MCCVWPPHTHSCFRKGCVVVSYVFKKAVDASSKKKVFFFFLSFIADSTPSFATKEHPMV